MKTHENIIVLPERFW